MNQMWSLGKWPLGRGRNNIHIDAFKSDDGNDVWSDDELQLFGAAFKRVLEGRMRESAGGTGECIGAFVVTNIDDWIGASINEASNQCCGARHRLESLDITTEQDNLFSFYFTNEKNDSLILFLM